MSSKLGLSLEKLAVMRQSLNAEPVAQEIDRSIVTSGEALLQKFSPRKRIVQLWLQGESKVPPLVRICMQSVTQFLPNKAIDFYDVHRAESEGLIGSAFIDLWRRKKITSAGIADLIRFEALGREEAIWLDATILLTEAPIGLLQGSTSFYTWRNKEFRLERKSSFLFPNYAMGSSPESRVFFSDVSSNLRSWWLSKGRQTHYFDGFYVAHGVLRRNPSLLRYIASQAPAEVEVQHLLAHSLRGGQFDALQIEPSGSSAIHKLSLKHKYNAESLHAIESWLAKR